ncbi:hypothetical protein BGX28_002735 [Mortierella sp. GBA30]|nr:hypothetical protein BGX28_002735 [Mortierella sp. GBA30]
MAGTSDCQTPRSFPYLPSCITDQHVMAISSNLTQLTSLSLCHCTALTDMAAIQIITAPSPYLKKIDLTDCRLITDLAVHVIAQLCNQLEELSLQGCGLVTDDALVDLALHCTRLQKINIGLCHRVSDKTLMALLESSGRMTQLDPTSKVRTRNARLSKLAPNHMASAASRFFQTLPSTLEEIIIHNAYVLNRDDINCLVDRVGVSLKVLQLDNANAINSETLTHILTACPNLTVLCIPRAIRLDDAGVARLAEAKCARSLAELDLSSCHSLTDACLTSLAKSVTSTMETTVKGKFVGEHEGQASLFPNLRRLDLSYNDKMTLAGIIPMVMSLKNLCALDVSFCGEGVTRPWTNPLSSTLLSPRSFIMCQDVTQGNDPSASGNTSAEGYEESTADATMSMHQQPAQLSYLRNSQSLIINVAAAVAVPSRPGVGRYVGPRLNLSGPPATSSISQNNNLLPQHPQQYPGQGFQADRHQYRQQMPQYTRRRSSASSVSSSSSSSSASSSSSSASTASSTTSYSSTSTLLSGDENRYEKAANKDPCLYSHHQQPPRCLPPEFSIPLAGRMDVLENTPTRVGIPPRFHQDSWFTPQHQQQLQQLYSMQIQQQRDLQDQQAQALLTGAGQDQQPAIAMALAHATAMSALSPEMMAHPIMAAARVGVASMGGDGGAHGRGRGRGQGQTQEQGYGQGYRYGNPITSYLRDLNENLNTRLRIRSGDRFSNTPGVEPSEGSRASGSGVGTRPHHRLHRQPLSHQRREPFANAVLGHCEISGWGLMKLKEEWSAI